MNDHDSKKNENKKRKTVELLPGLFDEIDTYVDTERAKRFPTEHRDVMNGAMLAFFAASDSHRLYWVGQARVKPYEHGKPDPDRSEAESTAAAAKVGEAMLEHAKGSGQAPQGKPRRKQANG